MAGRDRTRQQALHAVGEYRALPAFRPTVSAGTWPAALLHEFCRPGLRYSGPFPSKSRHARARISSRRIAKYHRIMEHFGVTHDGPKVSTKSVDNFVENLSVAVVKLEQILEFFMFAKNLAIIQCSDLIHSSHAAVQFSGNNMDPTRFSIGAASSSNSL